MSRNSFAEFKRSTGSERKYSLFFLGGQPLVSVFFLSDKFIMALGGVLGASDRGVYPAN